MHKFIYSQKDSWISETTSSQNFGGDEILEIQKYYFEEKTKGVSRALVYFNLTDISKSIDSGEIKFPKFYLRMYSTEQSSLPASYTLKSHLISGSWEEGTGKLSSNPVVKDGVTWTHKDIRNSSLSWSLYDNDGTVGTRVSSGSRPGHSIFENGGCTFFTGSGFEATQSFSYESPDIRMDVTNLVHKWLSGSTYVTNPEPFPNSIPNEGLVVKFTGSLESTGSTDRGNLKFFSRNTHTIYPPKIEVVWDDHVGPPNYTSSFTALDMSGETDNYVYVKGLRESYKETETAKFRVGARKKYVGRTFSTSVQTITGSFIAEGSGSYSIVDIHTGETIVPFGDYSLLSLDSGSMYFNQDLNSFQPNRIYKILVRVKYNDGQEIIYDDNSEFKVER
tara:strand:- start:247 stop:1419 length:1173 start_codon:yes stop_codon:yes gene_type:complete